MSTILTTNDSWPGRLAPGSEVELVGQSANSVLVRVGKRTVKASAKWFDWPSTETVRPRGLHVTRGML